MIAKLSKDPSVLIAFDEGIKYTFKLICTRAILGVQEATGEGETDLAYTVLFSLALKTKGIMQKRKLDIAKRLGAWIGTANIHKGKFTLVDGSKEHDYEAIAREILLNPRGEDEILGEFSSEEKAHLRELKEKLKIF